MEYTQIVIYYWSIKHVSPLVRALYTKLRTYNSMDIIHCKLFSKRISEVYMLKQSNAITIASLVIGKCVIIINIILFNSQLLKV